MAHSRVFQFEKIKKSEFDDNDIELLNENTLEESQFPFAVDYWRDYDDIEDIKEDFKHLVTYVLCYQSSKNYMIQKKNKKKL